MRIMLERQTRASAAAASAGSEAAAKAAAEAQLAPAAPSSAPEPLVTQNGAAGSESASAGACSCPSHRHCLRADILMLQYTGDLPPARLLPSRGGSTPNRLLFTNLPLYP